MLSKLELYIFCFVVLACLIDIHRFCKNIRNDLADIKKHLSNSNTNNNL